MSHTSLLITFDLSSSLSASQAKPLLHCANAGQQPRLGAGDTAAAGSAPVWSVQGSISHQLESVPQQGERGFHDGAWPHLSCCSSPLCSSPHRPEDIHADSHSHTFAQVAPSPGDLAYSPLPTWVFYPTYEKGF